MGKYLLVLGVLASLAGWVRADFIVDPNPDGAKLFIDKAGPVSSFTGHVYNQTSGPVVDVTTIGSVDTGSGWATIYPIKDGSLTSLTFTPVDDTLFDSFSFHCQLVDAGVITLVVTDNDSQTFTFTVTHANQLFGPFGIIAVGGTDETIKSITLTNAGFKEVKQIDFGFAPGGLPYPPTIPVPPAVWGGLGLLGLLGVRRAVRGA